MNWVFDPPRVPRVRAPEGDYPVRRIFCVGRNYAAHAAEMGVAVDREKPFYFTKSPAHIAPSGSIQPYPLGTENYHYEIELAVYLGDGAIYGYGVALDMTRRDLQLAERKHQRPWSLGKDVEGSAILAPMATDWTLTPTARIKLSRNGEICQDATLGDMVWSVPEILAHLSRFYRLGVGDVVFTGTPAGVGPVVPGDTLAGEIDGLPRLALEIGPRATGNPSFAQAQSV